MPDDWEIAHGLDPLISNATLDSDNDGVSNYQEYLDATLPLDDTSCTNTQCLPVIVDFSASQTVIDAGDSLQLSWTTVNAVTVTLMPLNSVVANTGNQSVSPQQTTTYQLIASASSGSRVAVQTVQVIQILSEQRYNAMGQRTVKTTATESRLFIYGPNGVLLAELDEQGTPIREHVYMQNQPLAQVHYDENTGADTTYFVHNDHLGTPQLLTDGAQQVVWAGDYAPFGATYLTTEVVDNPIRFPGQFEEDETGFHYNWNRYYDPEIGRYITSDPIGLRGGVNTYGYAFQNPTKYIDQDGRLAFLAIPAFFGGGGSAAGAGSFAGAATFFGSAGLAAYYLNEIFGDDDLGDFGDDGETAHPEEEELLKATCDDADWAIPAIDAILKSRDKQHTDSGGHNPITNPDGKGHRERMKKLEKKKKWLEACPKYCP